MLKTFFLHLKWREATLIAVFFISLILLILQSSYLFTLLTPHNINSLPKYGLKTTTLSTNPQKGIPVNSLVVNKNTEATKASKINYPVPQIPMGRQIRVPILNYHYIGNNPNPADKARDSLSVSPDKFAAEMKYLADNHYSTITFDTLYPALQGTISLPPKPIILTFDDGYEDFFYNAFPILLQYHLRAVSFIPTGLMNQGYYLTWDQIRQMQRSGLISFEAHSVHHYQLTSLSDYALKAEIVGSKNTLQAELGVPVNFFAYPYGTYDGRVIQALKSAGFIGATSTWASKIQSQGTIFYMPRMRVGGYTDLNSFISLL